MIANPNYFKENFLVDNIAFYIPEGQSLNLRPLVCAEAAMNPGSKKRLTKVSKRGMHICIDPK